MWLAPRCPTPSLDRINELGAAADPYAHDLYEAVNSVARDAYRLESTQTETALRDHLATHTTEQFVAALHGLRDELAQLKGCEGNA